MVGSDPAVHVVPFQLSARVPDLPVALRNDPTPVHVVAAVQDTAFRCAALDPVGLVMGWIFHEVPFHPSARGVVADPDTRVPTASHDVALMHATPVNELPVAPAGTGTVLADQLVPFQVSARGCCRSFPEDSTVCRPAAMQKA